MSTVAVFLHFVTVWFTPCPTRAADPPREAWRIRVSGVLGQSQPADQSPLAFLSSEGAVLDATGGLWTAAGEKLLRFAPGPGAAWRQDHTAALPAGTGGAVRLASDGKTFFVLTSERVILAFDPIAPDAAVTVCCDLRTALPAIPKDFAVIPAGLTAGFAARSRFFLLGDDRVLAVDAAGPRTDTVVELQRPADAQWQYRAIGIEPKTGDLLVAGSWPDSAIHRFRMDGTELRNPHWPRPVPGHAERLAAIDGMAWVSCSDGTGLALPDAVFRDDDVRRFPGQWTLYGRGLALSAQSAAAWVASSQGLVEYDSLGKPVGRRMGGLPGVRTLAVAPDGTMVAAVEDGQRFIRLWVDDAPDAVLRSNGNEPWRTGNGWRCRAASVSWAGPHYLVLDEIEKRLWAFDPWHTAWKETPWIALTEKDTLTAPRAATAHNRTAWVLDGDRLLFGNLQQPVTLAAATVDGSPALSGFTFATALSETRVVLASRQELLALEHCGGGRHAVLWKAEAGVTDVRGLAAGDGFVAVTDAGAPNAPVIVIDPDTGRRLCTLASDTVPGGFTPGALAASGRWLYAADAAESRIVRLTVAPGTTSR
ncbi:MAG: hypothetical protein A3K19_33380 [Lentisphaerae bacterium RIFOXYB12_FULL_65_16]|nr:MAG: hypothetical protein A3K18_05865 [Lentisphaerae bacterium RIFOXYA12_64_32]OGV86923.1 MAG: hypothetical protein A3K19_33380 [Lentisphaerae bacterium RIFOXYB12_FULL_65_16]